MAGKVIEFDLGGFHYRASPLSARISLHIGKRLLQLAKALTPAAQSDTMAMVATAVRAPQDEAAPPDIIALMMPFVGSLGDAMSQLSDADFDYILDRCLETVERRTSDQNTWAKVVTRNGQVMFDDITAPVQIVMAGHVLKENLGDFFPALLRLLQQPTQGQAA